MRHNAYRMLIVACLVMSNGCLARQLTRDGASSQGAMSEIYTEQAMTNLIRARSNLPFVQLKYSGLSVNDNDEYTGNAGFTRSISTVADLVTGALARTVGDSYTPNATAKRSRTMSFNADPVVTENDVYTSYINFANDPGLFCVSDHAPSCTVHIHRKCGKKHYWVPAEAGPAFFELVMKTAIMRGPETAPPIPAAYETTIREVLNPKAIAGRDATNATLLFDKEIPNGNATMVFEMDGGRKVRVRLFQVDHDQDKVKISRGIKTKILDIQWSPKQDNFGVNDLVGKAVRIYSHDFPPEASAPDPVVRRIATDLNQIRVKVQNGGR